MVEVVPDDLAQKINAQLSKLLAEAREGRGISKKALAALANIDRSTVKFIEDPEENPTILNLIRYGLALKLDVGQIFSECLTPYLAHDSTKKTKN